MIAERVRRKCDENVKGMPHRRALTAWHPHGSCDCFTRPLHAVRASAHPRRPDGQAAPAYAHFSLTLMALVTWAEPQLRVDT
jgi:hypothetical protein